MAKKQELQVWTPSEFKGTDLLPTAGGSMNLLAPGEEVVGTENIEAEDLVLPVLSLLHGMSDPVINGMPGAKVGSFYLSVKEEVFTPPLRVLLVHHSKGAAMFPDEKRDGDSGVTCVSRDGIDGSHFGNCEECGRSEWRNGAKPLCAKSHNFVVWTPSGPAIFRCRVTTYKTAKKFVSQFKTSGLNMWHHPLLITTRLVPKDLGGKTVNYPVLDLTWMTKETVPPEMRAKCRVIYDEIAAAHEQGRMGSRDDQDGNSEGRVSR